MTSDDEVSIVLRHFRPRPGFVSNGIDHSGWTRPGGPRQRQRQTKRRGNYDRGFTSVRFVAARPSSSSGESNASSNAGGELRLAYLHVHDASKADDGSGSAICLFLTFAIGVSDKSVECVQCSAPDETLAARTKSYLDRRCSDLSSSPPSATEDGVSSTSTAAATPSLFLIASRLLQLLNDDFPIISPSIGDDGGASVNPTPSREEETLGALVRRVAASSAVPSERRPAPAARIHRMLDAQTLLMRCAAAGRNRSDVCAPVPAEFARAAGAGGGDDPARLVFAASNRLYARGFRDGGRRREPTGRRRDGSDPEAARTLLSFLLSLPWTGGGRLTTGAFVDGDARDGDRDDGDGRETTPESCGAGRLCLDVGGALGDESPAFSRRASEYGTIRAYHGTRIDSAWSILNHGLQNLSHHGALGRNGAMMGEGVYLSSSRRVAESFAIKAAERPPSALSSAFQHESLLHLLCHAGVDVAGLDPLDSYDITCLPVFEATIIKPPPPPPPCDDSEKAGSSGDCTTRQEGKYFVCADEEFVRITKLHLTIELSKKPDVWQWLPSRIPLSLIALLVAFWWAMG